MRDLYQKATEIGPTRESLASKLVRSATSDLWAPRPQSPTSKRPISKLPRDYFEKSTARSRPRQATTTETLIYQCRKPPMSYLLGDGTESNNLQNNDVEKEGSKSSKEAVAQEAKIDSNFDAQRKVAKTLLTMAKNEAMTQLFISKGGMDHVIRLLTDSLDLQVLATCAECITQAVSSQKYSKMLIDKKDILYSLGILIERGDLLIQWRCGKILVKLSSDSNDPQTPQREIDDLLISHGILPLASTLIAASAESIETVCLTLISLCNIAPALLEDLDSLIRIILQSVKRFDIQHVYSHAFFIVDCICNLTRLRNQFGEILVEESVLPLLLHLMEVHDTEDMIGKVVEAFVNLSVSKKNRREISTCGISAHLEKIFDVKQSTIRSHMLTMIGNLLESGFFHDRIAKEDIVNRVIYGMFNPKESVIQFVAVSYFLSQLAQAQLASAAVLVGCGAIGKVLTLLRQSPSQEATVYLWSFLVNVSNEETFFDNLMNEADALFREIHIEAEGAVQAKTATKGFGKDKDLGQHSEEASQVILNLSVIHKFSSIITEDHLRLIIVALIGFFECPRKRSCRINAARALVNIASTSHLSRQFIILGRQQSNATNNLASPVNNDKKNKKFNLIAMFEDHGIEEGFMNLLFISLINCISMEENCVIKLLEMGALKFLISVNDQSFTLTKVSQSPTKGPRRERAESSGSGSGSPRKVSMISRFHLLKSMNSVNNSGYLNNQSQNFDAPVEIEVDMEVGRNIISATIHNLMIKRAAIIPGTLTCVFNLIRNCRNSRVLHCMRAMAHMSLHSKSKVILAKEGRIIPEIAAIMRLGCDDADRVQHFGALVICNLLATLVEKVILEDLVHRGAIVDLVVVTLLRINDIKTKEILGKSLFNLMCRSDFRLEMVLHQDLLAAMLELSKVDSPVLLELCVRSVYNISCEISAYSEKLFSLHAPTWLINKLTNTTSSLTATVCPTLIPYQ